MSELHLSFVLGTIWIAPHAPSWLGQIVGLIFIGIGVSKGIGLL
jgi:hypothetical protein